MNKLFELPEETTTNETCRNCEHRERWQCGSKVIQYCGVLKSNRTSNGKKKIKVTDKACLSFKPVTK